MGSVHEPLHVGCGLREAEMVLRVLDRRKLFVDQLQLQARREGASPADGESDLVAHERALGLNLLVELIGDGGGEDHFRC